MFKLGYQSYPIKKKRILFALKWGKWSIFQRFTVHFHIQIKMQYAFQLQLSKFSKNLHEY